MPMKFSLSDLPHYLSRAVATATAIMFGIFVGVTIAAYFSSQQKQPSALYIPEQHSTVAYDVAKDSRPQRFVTVLYATNRAVEIVDSARGKVTKLSYKRSPDLIFGSAVVRVPEEHKIGAVERPLKVSIYGITILNEEEKESKHFILSEVTVLTREEFAAVIRENTTSSALVFVHGFNSTFEDAVFRLGQIAWDLQYRGVPVAFFLAIEG